jgi:hypothetical protein
VMPILLTLQKNLTKKYEELAKMWVQTVRFWPVELGSSKQCLRDAYWAVMLSHAFLSHLAHHFYVRSPHSIHNFFFYPLAPFACWAPTTLACDNFAFPSKLILSF